MRSRRVVVLLGLLWVTGLGFVLLRGIPGTSTRAIAQPGTSNAPLACADVYRIGTWSGARFGGLRRFAPQSGEFRDRALGAYLEKLDPYKLLFTEGDVQSFRSGARAAWRRFLDARQCEWFDAWPAAAMSIAKQKLGERLAALPLDAIFAKASAEAKKGKGGAAEDLEWMPRGTAFAKDGKLLSARLQEVVARLAGAATPRVLGAYGGDRLAYVRDSLEQVLFENTPAPRDLLAKAFLGAMDSYSTFLPASEFDDFYVELAGGSSGVGIRIRRVPRGLLVEKVLADSAASRSKALAPGDLIVAVDGVPVSAVAPRMAKRLLTGPEGSAVSLKIERVGASGEGVDVRIERRRFVFEEARLRHELRQIKEGRDKGKLIAVVDVPSFYGRGGAGGLEERSSAEDLHKLLTSLLRSHGKQIAAVMLDVRGNPGGYLEEAVSMAGLFLGERTVVAVVEKDGERVMRDTRRDPVYRGPLVVLVDEESASAAEVLAGALKDQQRAIVVGSSRSYGKGSVQKLFHLDDELSLPIPSRVYGTSRNAGVVKLTTSVFYSPLGHSPAGNGVRSDVSLKKEEGHAMAEEAAPRRAGDSVPDHSPFLDEDELRQVHARMPLMQKIVRELRARHGEPKQDADSLDTAVAVTADYASLVAAGPGPR